MSPVTRTNEARLEKVDAEAQGNPRTELAELPDRDTIHQNQMTVRQQTVLLVILAIATKVATAGDCPRVATEWKLHYDQPGVRVYALTTLPDGGIVVGGNFGGRVDLDPTEGLEVHESGDSENLFLTKLGTEGTYAWTHAVGGADPVGMTWLAATPGGDLILGGSFRGELDFDPGPGLDVHTTAYDPCLCLSQAFVMLIGPEGAYQGTSSFEGSGRSSGNSGALDSTGAILVTGGYGGTVDFDPGPGVDERSATTHDIYVTKLASDGAHVWTRTFAGGGFDYGTHLVTDTQDNVIVGGIFRGVVDFDPGPGEDRHQARRFPEDRSVTKLYPDGSYGWTRTFSVPTDGSIATDDAGAVYVSGILGVTADLDPTVGTDVRVGPAGFVVKLAADGSYVWARMLDGGATAVDIAVDAEGNLLVTGYFQQWVDLDPGPATDLHFNPTPNAYDGFLVKLSNDGEFIWSRVWAVDPNIFPRHVAVDGWGSIFVSGVFRGGAADLDPGCPVDLRGVNADWIVKFSCQEPSADADGDGDVDLADLAAFQNCYTGPWGDEAPTCAADCPPFDFATDDALDLDDYFAVSHQLTGP